MAPLEATIQYLNWALIAAHGGAHEDCREVNVKLNLVQKTATTSFTKKDAPDGSDDGSRLAYAVEKFLKIAYVGENAKLFKELKAALESYRG